MLLLNGCCYISLEYCMSKLRKNEAIKSIMVTNPITINQNTKISEAAALFQENAIHHLPVVSGEKLIGMFSYLDLMKIDYSASFGEDSRQSLKTLDSTKTIIEVMTDNPETIRERETIRDAAKILSNGAYHSLPVVDEKNCLMGIVTSTDVIRYLAEL